MQQESSRRERGRLRLGITSCTSPVMLSTDVHPGLWGTKEMLVLCFWPQTPLHAVNASTLSPRTPGRFHLSLSANTPALRCLSRRIATTSLCFRLPHQTRAPWGPSVFLVLCIPHPSSSQGVWHSASTWCRQKNHHCECGCGYGPGRGSALGGDPGQSPMWLEDPHRTPLPGATAHLLRAVKRASSLGCLPIASSCP